MDHKNLAFTAIRRASRLHGNGSLRRMSLAANRLEGNMPEDMLSVAQAEAQAAEAAHV